MADGHLGACKACIKEERRLHREMNKVRIQAYERVRALLPARRESQVRYQRAQHLRHPEKCRARTAVSNAIRDGRMIPQPCERCGKDPAEAHHDDYNKPLTIRWLCKSHHWEHHKAMSGEDYDPAEEAAWEDADRLYEEARDEGLITTPLRISAAR